MTQGSCGAELLQNEHEKRVLFPNFAVFPRVSLRHAKPLCPQKVTTHPQAGGAFDGRIRGEYLLATMFMSRLVLSRGLFCAPDCVRRFEGEYADREGRMPECDSSPTTASEQSGNFLP